MQIGTPSLTLAHFAAVCACFGVDRTIPVCSHRSRAILPVLTPFCPLRKSRRALKHPRPFWRRLCLFWRRSHHSRVLPPFTRHFARFGAVCTRSTHSQNRLPTHLVSDRTRASCFGDIPPHAVDRSSHAKQQGPQLPFKIPCVLTAHTARRQMKLLTPHARPTASFHKYPFFTIQTSGHSASSPKETSNAPKVSF